MCRTTLRTPCALPTSAAPCAHTPQDNRIENLSGYINETQARAILMKYAEPDHHSGVKGQGEL